MFYNNRKLQSNSVTERNRKVQEIYKDEMNNECFDCGKSNPEFISANNGVFICRECMSVHYQFSDEVSLIIKNNLFLLNEEQINYIYYGGNRKLLEFINYEFPQLQNYQPEILYKTQAMQYYRDKLYFLVEGGNKPMKPNEHFAYKLINNIVNFPRTEKREKLSSNNINNNYDRNDEIDEFNNRDSDNNSSENEDDINSNLNINNYYHSLGNNDIDDNNNIKSKQNIVDTPNNPSNNNSFVYIKHKMNRNNSFISNKTADRSSTNFRRNKIKLREPENINIVPHNNNSNVNFYQKRDNFFKEMNRLFGANLEDEDNTKEKKGSKNINNTTSNISCKNAKKENNYFYQMNTDNKNFVNNNVQKAYKINKPKNNYYTNYIKNTININNNNTNIYLDENAEFNKNILSKSQCMNNENDNINNNFTFGHNNNIINNVNNNNNNDNNDVYSKSTKNESQFKNKNKNKININIKKKIYIKPKVMEMFNPNDSKNPSIIVDEINNKNYRSVPIDEPKKRLKHKKLNCNLNNDIDVNESGKSEKKDNVIFNTLSPTLVSQEKNNNSLNQQQPNVFSKKNVNYTKKIIKNEKKNNNIIMIMNLEMKELNQYKIIN